MKKNISTLIILFFALSVSAQDVIWKMTYDVAFPFSSTKEFTDQVSWRGAALDVDRFVTDNMAVGLGMSWSTFVEKESDSDFNTHYLLIHGTQVRYINTVPLLARFSYYAPLDVMDVYGTLGIGTTWQEIRREIGTFSFANSYWQFALSPEVGVLFPVGNSFMTAKLRYVHSFKTSEAPDLSYLGIGLGFAW
ncbi:MAG: hypothetical protein ABFS28_15005 [Bacteroidota bacterium]